MKLFDKTFIKFCQKHGISHLWYNPCQECVFDKNSPQLSKSYINNVIRKY